MPSLKNNAQSENLLPLDGEMPPPPPPPLPMLLATSADGTLQSIVQDLTRMQHLSERGIQAALANCPKCHFGVLEGLYLAIQACGINDTIYVTELARQFRKPMPAISRWLSMLESEGLISRQTDSADRRKIQVRITPKGETARRKNEQAIESYFSRVMARMPQEQIMQLLALHECLNEAIAAETASMEAAEELRKNRKGTSNT